MMVMSEGCVILIGGAGTDWLGVDAAISFFAYGSHEINYIRMQ